MDIAQTKYNNIKTKLVPYEPGTPINSLPQELQLGNLILTHC
jgi:hypothetical protein